METSSWTLPNEVTLYILDLLPLRQRLLLARTCKEFASLVYDRIMLLRPSTAYGPKLRRVLSARARATTRKRAPEAAPPFIKTVILVLGKAAEPHRQLTSWRAPATMSELVLVGQRGRANSGYTYDGGASEEALHQLTRRPKGWSVESQAAVRSLALLDISLIDSGYFYDRRLLQALHQRFTGLTDLTLSNVGPSTHGNLGLDDWLSSLRLRSLHFDVEHTGPPSLNMSTLTALDVVPRNIASGATWRRRIMSWCGCIRVQAGRENGGGAVLETLSFGPLPSATLKHDTPIRFDTSQTLKNLFGDMFPLLPLKHLTLAYSGQAWTARMLDELLEYTPLPLLETLDIRDGVYVPPDEVSLATGAKAMTPDDVRDRLLSDDVGWASLPRLRRLRCTCAHTYALRTLDDDRDAAIGSETALTPFPCGRFIDANGAMPFTRTVTTTGDGRCALLIVSRDFDLWHA